MKNVLVIPVVLLFPAMNYGSGKNFPPYSSSRGSGGTQAAPLPPLSKGSGGSKPAALSFPPPLSFPSREKQSNGSTQAAPLPANGKSGSKPAAPSFSPPPPPPPPSKGNRNAQETFLPANGKSESKPAAPSFPPPPPPPSKENTGRAAAREQEVIEEDKASLQEKDDADLAVQKEAAERCLSVRQYEEQIAQFKQIQEKINGASGKEIMRRIQPYLQRDVVLFDTLGDGRCGYYALVALRRIRDAEQGSTISISAEDVKADMKAISDLIWTESVGFEADPGRRGDGSPIDVLRASILTNPDAEVYRPYISNDQINWKKFCKHLETGRVQYDQAFMYFTREALKLYGIECIGCDGAGKGNIDRGTQSILGGVSSEGALIRITGNHFLVALPKYINGGTKIQQIRCQGPKKEWWTSTPGMPAVLASGDSEE
ncbi:MAG: hypothetical protein LBJ71_01395 [Holosporaceae bacterium]|jgi:hypothetical protein|nr:hypothetical protein [Holosporaceae bacterium]